MLAFQVCYLTWLDQTAVDLLLGSHITFEVRNTTSVYVRLRSGASRSHKVDGRAAARQVVSLADTQKALRGWKSASLMVMVDEQHITLFNATSHGTLEVARSLKVDRSHFVTITNLKSSAAQGNLEFEGIWVDKGAAFTRIANDRTLQESVFAYQVSAQQHPNTFLQPRLETRKLIEVVAPLSLSSPSEALTSYAHLLARSLNASESIVPIAGHCLTIGCSSVTMQHLYFRAGPPTSSLFALPYRLSTPPSAFVISIGLHDFTHHLSASPSTHATSHFTSTFVTAYIKFIRTIRSCIVSHHPSSAQFGLDPTVSFNYNSAPSFLPIFLLTPFTPDRRLKRLLSHAIATVAHTVQSDGDRSTFWIDTSGWLLPHDFTVPRTSDMTLSGEDSFPIPELTQRGHAKVAEYLSYHLCPYLTSSYEEEKEKCAFNKLDHYQGHLIVPEEEGVGMQLEERKLELIEEALGLNWNI